MPWKNWEWEKTFIGHGNYVYAYCPEHPYASPKGWVKEHILVMENRLRGPLPKMSRVLHKNGVTWDNRPENLTLEKVQTLAGRRYKKKAKQSGA